VFGPGNIGPAAIQTTQFNVDVNGRRFPGAVRYCRDAGRQQRRDVKVCPGPRPIRGAAHPFFLGERQADAQSQRDFTSCQGDSSPAAWWAGPGLCHDTEGTKNWEPDQYWMAGSTRTMVGRGTSPATMSGTLHGGKRFENFKTPFRSLQLGATLWTLRPTRWFGPVCSSRRRSRQQTPSRSAMGSPLQTSYFGRLNGRPPTRRWRKFSQYRAEAAGKAESGLVPVRNYACVECDRRFNGTVWGDDSQRTGFNGSPRFRSRRIQRGGRDPVSTR